MLNRREFAAAGVASTLNAAAVKAQSGQRIKAAFLGASHSHGLDKVRLVHSSPDFELAGVWEENPSVRDGLQKAVAKIRWMSKADILADKSISAVFIESDVKSHGPLAIEALRAGKHCHIEKPPAETLRDMREIVSLAKSTGLIIQSGYMWRHNPAVEKALEAARSGWLGQIYLIQARMNTLIGTDRRPEWNLFSGGQMFEQGAHLVDIVVRLMGKPARITPFLRHDGPFNDTLKDNTAAVLEYGTAMAILVSSVLQPNANAHRAIEIFGTNGNAVIRPIEPPSLEIDLQKAAGPYQAGKQKPALRPYERYSGDIAALASAIAGSKPLEVNADTELAIQEVLLTASGMIG